MKRQRQKQAERARGGAEAQEITIPLPLNGIFAEAKTAEMSGVFAGELINWRSNGASLEFRPQYSLAGAGDFVLQRIPYEFGSTVSYIEAAASTIQTDTDSIQRAFVRNLDSALISGRTIMVDGLGPPIQYNGTNLIESTFTTNTGRIQDDFDGIVAHQDRPFFWQSGDELDFYYGDVGAITGSLSRFPLGRLGNITGRIVAMLSLTVDAGHGMNDTLAIFTSTGTIIAYEGLNPADANDWRQLARIQSATPVNKNAFVQVGADVWMLTASGIVSILETMRNSTMALVNTVSRPIRKKLLAQVAEGGDWSLHRSADSTQIIINRFYNGASTQFIYRTDSKSWDETDYPAKFWHNLDGKTQFTTITGDLATLDDAGNVVSTAKWTTSWFRLPRSSGISYLVPTILARGPLEFKITVLTDHDETAIDISEAEQTITVQPDNPADPNGTVSLNEMIGVDAVGDVFQMRMEVTAANAEFVNLKAGII